MSKRFIESEHKRDERGRFAQMDTSELKQEATVEIDSTKPKPASTANVYDTADSKKLKEILYNYSNGYYGGIVDVSDAMLKGEEAISAYREKMKPDSLSKPRDWDVDGNMDKASTIMRAIDRNPFDETPLYRVESAPYGGKLPKVGEEITWGIRSFSSDKDFPYRAIRGEDKGMQKLAELYGYDFSNSFDESQRPIVYEVVGKKKHLNIQEFSKYEEQAESLMYGTFVVEEIKDAPLESGIETFSFDEEVKRNHGKYKLFKAKSGRDMVEVDGKTYTLASMQNKKFYQGGDSYEYDQQEWRNKTRPRIIVLRQK